MAADKCPCEQVVKCCKCGKVLCSHDDDYKRVVVGHYVYSEAVYCVDCWEKSPIRNSL